MIDHFNGADVVALLVIGFEKILANWPILIPVFLTGFFAWRNLKVQIKANRKVSLQMFNLQKKKEDAHVNLPVVIEMLEDLAALQQAFIHHGLFIPGREHRCPTIQLKDGEKKDEVSIAERVHLLYLIALRIIRNSRKIIFLTPEGMMPKTVMVCKQIRDDFQSKKPGKKRYFEINIGAIAIILQHGFEPVSREQRQEESYCDKFVIELEKYQIDLECQVQEEFPTYAKEEWRK